MKKNILVLVISSVALSFLIVKVSTTVNSLNVVTFLVFGAILPALVSSIMGCSLINILKIQKDKVKIIGSGVFALVYSVCYLIFIKLINLDFEAIARNSQNLSNNSSIQINAVSSQSVLTTGLINFFLVFSLIVIFSKIKEKAGERYV
ncbi:hypothetical protein B9N49_08865 [Finegoldia magna]|uniref:Uncharacterized protein n=1 Tax=Finegoldia magna TaxID=1260 RepID=A0A233V270_FINMA|nr:hypothetical protein [Finegoldia magna]MDU1831857.1 hypothetical protein [Finegoldia magna]MDU1878035.1 hypothetical protein [Finegoldia magna]MDU2544561.1 hypothetical protein [Finegoldia magna]OXZ26507.1 hypothetical protein B9N49_08865 [Finegoldia magna]